MDTGSIQGISSTKEAVVALNSGTSSMKEAVLALNSQPLGLARHAPASLAEEAGKGALFVLANVVDQTKVVEDSVSNVLLNQPVRDSPCEEAVPAQLISERVRDQETIEKSAAIEVHNGEEINGEVIWEQMQKLQSEVSANSLALLSCVTYFWKFERLPSVFLTKLEVSSIQ